MKPLTPLGEANHDADAEHEVIDASVSRALNMLAHAAPPAGMEARILSHLRQRSEAGPSTFARRIFAVRPQLWVAGALACLLVAVVVLRPAHREPVVSSVASSAAVSPSSSPQPVAPASGNDVVPEGSSASRQIRHARPSSSTRPANARLVSFPAPPRPLTEQERLLLAVAASNPSPEVISVLDPVQRTEAAARSEQQFLASLTVNDSNASTSSGDHQ